MEKFHFWRKNRQIFGRLARGFTRRRVILAVWQEVSQKIFAKFFASTFCSKAGSKAGPGEFYKNSDATAIRVWRRVLLKNKWFRARLRLEKFCVAKFLMVEK